MNVIKNIVDVVKSFLIDNLNKKYIRINKDTLITKIEQYIVLNKTFVSDLEMVSKSDMNMIYANFKKNYKNYQGVKDYYDLYLKGLSSKAKSLEKNKIGLSMITVAKNNITNLTNLQKNIETIFEKDYLNPENMTIVDSLILSNIYTVEISSEWFYQFMVLLFAISNGESIETPKYRTIYLEQNLNNVISIANSNIETNGFSTFLKDIVKINEKTLDRKFIIREQNFNINVDKAIPGLEDAIKAVDAITSATLSKLLFYVSPVLIGLIRWLPVKIEEYYYNKYLRHQQLKITLQTLIARSEQKKINLDPNDPEYQRLEKIIENYDQILIDLDEKIYKYEQGV